MSELQPRNNTGTIALRFSGQADSVVTLTLEDHPPIITNQLTIRLATQKYNYFTPYIFATSLSLCSLWLLLTGDTSGGVLLAKTTDSGSTIFYGLEMMANGDDFLIRFSYLPVSRTVL